MNSDLVRAVAATLGILSVVSCGSITSPDSELSAARQRWAQKGPSSYEMTVYRSCECTNEMTGPVIVTVENGVITSRKYKMTGAAVDPSFFETFTDVPGLFAKVEGIHRDDPYKWDVDYDPELGYPRGIGVDQVKNMIDDEYSLSVWEFKAK